MEYIQNQKKLFMTIKKYQFYLSKIFMQKILIVSFVFFCIGVIINFFEEVKFFNSYEVSLYFPLFLTFLNTPILLFELFPFILLISTCFFYIHLSENEEIDVLNNYGINNLKLLSILSLNSILFGIIILLVFYSFSAELKNKYLNLKNKFSENNEYLAVINENGLWIKEIVENNQNIIHAKEFRHKFLEDITITVLNSEHKIDKTILAKKANISEDNWTLYGVKIIDHKKGIKELDKINYQSSFNESLISNLFSNLNSLNLFELFKLYKNYKKIEYSTTEVSLQINKLFSQPLFFLLMSVLGYLLVSKYEFIKSKFFTIIFAIFISVVIYYLNYISKLFGENETIPIILSIWLPHLIIFLICLLGVIKINEK